LKTLLNETRIFGGLDVEKNPRVIDGKNTPSCVNVRIDSLIGALTNDIGKVKKRTNSYSKSIVGIQELHRIGYIGPGIDLGIDNVIKDDNGNDTDNYIMQ
jgi:hypothetical protein